MSALFTDLVRSAEGIGLRTWARDVQAGTT